MHLNRCIPDSPHCRYLGGRPFEPLLQVPRILRIPQNIGMTSEAIKGMRPHNYQWALFSFFSPPPLLLPAKAVPGLTTHCVCQIKCSLAIKYFRPTHKGQRFAHSEETYKLTVSKDSSGNASWVYCTRINTLSLRRLL